VKCSLCRHNDAVYVIKTVIRKKMTELRLCAHCIEKKEKELGLKKGALMYYAVPIALTRLERDIFPKDATGLSCPECGLLYSDFKVTGQLGCPQCYKAFAPHLKLFFKLTQGAETYCGKDYVPPDGGPYLKYALLDRKTIQSELREAVKTEDFEKAGALKKILEAKAETPAPRKKKNSHEV